MWMVDASQLRGAVAEATRPEWHPYEVGSEQKAGERSLMPLGIFPRRAIRPDWHPGWYPYEEGSAEPRSWQEVLDALTDLPPEGERRYWNRKAWEGPTVPNKDIGGIDTCLGCNAHTGFRTTFELEKRLYVAKTVVTRTSAWLWPPGFEIGLTIFSPDIFVCIDCEEYVQPCPECQRANFAARWIDCLYCGLTYR
jgi:hypothetical protein